MTMALSFPNRFDGASVSGVGWTETLPLSNLGTRQLSQIARAISETGSFYVAFSEEKQVGAAALVNHNMSTDGKWRVRGFTSDPRPAVELDFTQGLVPSGVVCSRGSTAYAFGSDGLLKSFSNDVARLSFDPVTFACLGLLQEASAINALNYCRDGTNAAWVKTTMTSALTATGIDGTASSATRLTATSSNARISHAHSVGGTPYVFSVWLKRISGSGMVQITAENFSASSTVTLSSAWQRFEVVGSSGAAVGIQIDTSGDVIEMDFAQCELGSVASSPILTTSGAVTRQGDVFSYVPNGLAMSGALAVAGRLLRRPSADSALASVNDGTGSAAIYISSAGVPTGQYSNGGTQCNITVAALANNDTFGMAFTYAANDYRFASSGTQGTQDTSGTVRSGSATSISIGNASNRFGVVFTRLAAYSTTKSNADLNALASFTDGEHVAQYDSGLIDAWPADWISGTGQEQRTGARGLALLSVGASPSYRYWRIDFTDPANAAGYVQIGRVFMGSSWRPDHGMLNGASIGYESRSTTTEADDGAEYHSERRGPRVVRFNLEAQTQDEAMMKILEMQRQLGSTGEILFQWDIGDTLYQPARTFLGRLRSLSPLTAINSNLWSASFEVKELL